MADNKDGTNVNNKMADDSVKKTRIPKFSSAWWMQLLMI